MDRSGTTDVSDTLARQFWVARNVLRFHEFPRGVTLRRRDHKVWAYDAETQTLKTDLLLSGKILAPKIPVRMEVGFTPGTDSVRSVSVMCIDPGSGTTYGSQIGTSPMTEGGPFRTEFRGVPVEVDWDHALQTVHYFANLYANADDEGEIVAVRRLHAFGSVHGRAVGDMVPGVAQLEDMDASAMIGDGAGPDTEFGRALSTCVAIASRFELTVSRDHVKAVVAVANLWARHGQAIEDNFVFDPVVIPVDFRSGRRTPPVEGAAAASSVAPRF